MELLKIYYHSCPYLENSLIIKNTYILDNTRMNFYFLLPDNNDTLRFIYFNAQNSKKWNY